MKYTPVIGLEIHVELKTKSKMFCSCPNDPEAKEANRDICPVCMGHPGTLPVINEDAVRKVVKAGLALGCDIPEYSKFDRKNYFYPDLPKGYQISQYDMPLCQRGKMKVGGKEIRITRIHLEEDTGSLVHSSKEDSSLVSFNRAGIPLMELVTEPDFSSGKEARKFAEELRLILRYLDVSFADMEKGQMRVEVNISLSKNSQKGTKVEIKNLNSFRAVEKSVDYEIERQQEVLEEGKKVVQETRGWDEKKQKPLSQREKEEAHDYRYLPEPDLPTLHLESSFISEIKAEIPELPGQRKERLLRQYPLDEKMAEFFTVNKEMGEYLEQVCSELKNWMKHSGIKEEKEHEKAAKLAANYISSDLMGLLEGASVESEDFLITPENFAEFILLVYKKEISSKIAKQVLKEMFKTGADPSHIIKEKELSQVSDEAELEKIAKKVIGDNKKAVDDYKKGKENALKFLMGQIMAATRGRAEPERINQILKKLLQ